MYEDFPFDMRDVAVIAGLRIKHRGTVNWEVYCPFCNDEKGKMTLNMVKNVFRCNRCGESGGMLDLYGKLYRVDYGTACREIKEALGKGTMRKDHAVQQKAVEKRIPEIPQAEPASLAERNKTYSCLLSCLPLTESHLQNLIKRGFSKERVEQNGYKSTIPFGYRKIAERLLEQGCTLRGVPGFYQEENGAWTVNLNAKNAGFLVPVRDRNGLIAGMQIRLDHPYDGRKYIWLSSANYPSGITSGSPVHFAGEKGQETVFVTEGPLKADLSHFLSGRTFVAVAGVNLYGNLPPVLKALKASGTRKIYEAYDMDKELRLVCGRDYKESTCTVCTFQETGYGSVECPKKSIKKRNIQRGCRNLYRLCREAGLEVTSLTWDADKDGVWNGNIKGVDDYLYWLQERDLSESSGTAGLLK